MKNGSDESFHIVNETSGIGYTPLKAYDTKYLYNYVRQTNTLYTAAALDLNRHFTSINRISEQSTVSTNLDDSNWLHSN